MRIRWRLKVWHVLFALTVILVGMYFTRSDEQKVTPNADVTTLIPKVNVHLATSLAKLKGESFRDLGKVRNDWSLDTECVPLKDTTTGVKICLYQPAKDKYVSKSLKSHGTWESGQLHELQSILKRDKELGLIDLGANLGIFSLLAASMGRKVLALDAYHGSVARMKKSVDLNRFADRVTIVEAALTSRRGFSFMFVPHDNAAGAYIHPIPKGLITPHDVQNHRVVKNLLLDDLIRFIDVNRAVLRIDIGGKEPMILAQSRIFDIIQVPFIFMTYTYKEDLRKRILIALEEIEIKGYSPKTSRMAYNALDLGDFENWPQQVIWEKKRA